LARQYVGEPAAGLLAWVATWLKGRSPHRLVVDAIVLLVLAALAEMLAQQAGANVASTGMSFTMAAGRSPSEALFWPMLWIFVSKVLFWPACVLAALGCVQLMGAAKRE